MQAINDHLTRAIAVLIQTDHSLPLADGKGGYSGLLSDTSISVLHEIVLIIRFELILWIMQVCGTASKLIWFTKSFQIQIGLYRTVNESDVTSCSTAALNALYSHFGSLWYNNYWNTPRYLLWIKHVKYFLQDFVWLAVDDGIW